MDKLKEGGPAWPKFSLLSQRLLPHGPLVNGTRRETLIDRENSREVRQNRKQSKDSRVDEKRIRVIASGIPNIYQQLEGVKLVKPEFLRRPPSLSSSSSPAF
jgi:hypothetical protein